MNILHLTLKAKWYDMINCGIKTEEYREIKDYWFKRLVWNPWEGEYYSKKYDRVVFHFGYTNRTMMFEITSITFDTGKVEWGAEKGKLYFVIKLGRRLG